jgi:hypothetical protein
LTDSQDVAGRDTLRYLPTWYAVPRSLAVRWHRSAMMPLYIPLLFLVLHVQDQPRARVECKEWHECRQLALDAAERQDYETFHDLAWRAVQTGPKNEPALMYLLARAQSLSGRPSDALVMLQRLAKMGAKTDAATSDDFRRVRALPGWTEFEGGNPSTSTAGSAPLTATPPAATPPAPSTATVSTPPPPERADRRPAPGEASPPPSPVAKPSPPAISAESARFRMALAPAGLAYDAVSRRFIVADREARRLTVVDEFSQHVANLASAQSAGFGSIAALEIDPRLGNLWVVSGKAPTAAGDAGEPGRTTLHKLQLISGRVLQSYALADRFVPAAFVDVAAGLDSTVLVLDATGHRVFRLRDKSSELEVAATLPDEDAVSIAPASDNLAYIATAGGISLVDLAARSVTPLRAASKVDLSRIARLRWHKGSLIAIQQAEGGYRAVRFTLDRAGRRVTGEQTLDAPLAAVAPTSATVSGGVLYYLAAGQESEMIIRKITLP